MTTNNHIELVIKPVWMQQPGESETAYRAFLEWAQGEGMAGAMSVARMHGLTQSDVTRNRWQERADVYWTDIQSRLAVGFDTALERLNVKALEAAFQMLDADREQVEDSESIKEKDAEGRLITKGRVKRKTGPSERIVAILLTKLQERAGEGAVTDYREILEAMVQDTEEGGEPSADPGVEGESSSA